GALLLAAEPAVLACRRARVPARTQTGSTGFDAVSKRLQAAVDRGHVKGIGLTVIRADQILYVKAFGSFTTDHVDGIASATKLASASAIMSLVDDGLLGRDEPASRFLPGMDGAKA